jgi:dTDP-glucose pyrophosphorylase
MGKSSNRKDIDESYSDYVDDTSAGGMTEITDANDTSISQGDLSSMKTATKAKLKQDQQTSQQAKRSNQNDR